MKGYPLTCATPPEGTLQKLKLILAVELQKRSGAAKDISLVRPYDKDLYRNAVAAACWNKTSGLGNNTQQPSSPQGHDRIGLADDDELPLARCCAPIRGHSRLYMSPCPCQHVIKKPSSTCEI